MEENIKDLIPFLNSHLFDVSGIVSKWNDEYKEIFSSIGLRWIKLSSPEVLITLRPILNPEYKTLFDTPKIWEEICAEISAGTTFSFREVNGYLNFDY